MGSPVASPAGRESVRGHLGESSRLLRAQNDVYQVLERVHLSVILFGRRYCAGLVRWINTRLVGEGTVSPGDLDLLLLADDPAEAAQAVIDAHAAQTAGQSGR